MSDEGQWARGHLYARTPRARAIEADDDGRRDLSAIRPDVTTRFHHLACAARHHAFKLRSALDKCTLDIPGCAELEAAIERTLSVVDAAEDDPATREMYQRFIADVRDARDDDALLVFADWLAQVGDPRGELSAVQRALETAVDGEARAALVAHEKELLATHRKCFLPERLDGKLGWRRGFVHRVAVVADDSDPRSLVRVFAHASFRLLRELAVVRRNAYSPAVVAANLPTPLPATLRVLELGDDRIGAVAPLLAEALPRLERLELRGAAISRASAIRCSRSSSSPARSRPSRARRRITAASCARSCSGSRRSIGARSPACAASCYASRATQPRGRRAGRARCSPA